MGEKHRSRRKHKFRGKGHTNQHWMCFSTPVPLPSAGEFEEVIMIAFGDRRDGWVGTEFLTLTIKNEPRLETRKPSTRAKWRSSSSACCSALENCLTLPTLLEMAIFRQPLHWNNWVNIG